ncbi:MAG: DUF1796 family putative cysteine peptidase [Mesosutterella sp.]|nr:DUF1796 family putative cysteine peptidase [Mesosutterella sp.]
MKTNFDFVISLGADCITAMCLKALSYRSASYPFDWLWRERDKKSQLEQVSDFLCLNFHDFLNYQDFYFLKKNKFGHNTIKNRKNKFVWEHENFDGNENEIIKNLIDKYNRRCQRLKHILNSNSKILFIYTEKNEIAFPGQIALERISRQIQETNPNSDISFLFIYNDPKLKQFEYKTEDINNKISVCYINNSKKFSPEDPWRRNIYGLMELLIKNIKFNNPLIEKQKEKVSVILPTYNDGEFLDTCLSSLLNQTYNNFEILVIDDSTNQEIKEIVNDINDQRVKYIRGKNTGLSGALNLGLSLADGEYIARADADDFYPANRFEKQVEFLEDNPEISVVGSYQQHFGKSNFLHKPPTSPEELDFALLFKCELCHSTLMFRRSSFIKNEIKYPEKSLQEDFELWNSLIGKIKFANIPEVLGYYRVHEGSITETKKYSLAKYEIDIIKKGLKRIFDLTVDKKFDSVLNWRSNLFWKGNNKTKVSIQKYSDQLFRDIERHNEITKTFDRNFLHECLKRLWIDKFGYRNMIDSEYAQRNFSQKNDWKVEFLGMPLIKFKNYYPSSDFHKRKIFIFNIPFIKITTKGNSESFYLFGIKIFNFVVY